jgi:hypothetical protein
MKVFRGSRDLTNDDDLEPSTKRIRQHESCYEPMCNGCEMSSSQTLPSQDAILIQMIQESGATSCDDVAQFCLSTGIPMSRMLRLDLVGLRKTQR